MQTYKIDILNYSTDGQVKSGCADITFFNAGARPIVINESITIPIGQSLSITANAGEIDITIYTYRFIPTTSAPGRLVIFRKIYI